MAQTAHRCGSLPRAAAAAAQSTKLAFERSQRASVLGRRPEEVAGAEGLFVRVVSCVDKRMDTKSAFYDLFRESGFPEAFAYRSKAVVLFQRLEGVDVCLFVMYLQARALEHAISNTRSNMLSNMRSKQQQPRRAARPPPRAPFEVTRRWRGC